MKKNSDIIFIHTNNAYDLGNGRYNIILSPAFYWIKKENVGVGSIFSAKKIASAVFEGEIPENEYKYFAKKTSQKGEYYFFAYNEKEILNKLKTLGVEIKNIKAIYFAQNEFENISNPILIDKKTAIIQKDGIISLAPANFIKEKLPFNPQAIKLSKFKIPIKTYNSFGLENSHIFTLSAILSILLLALIFENRHYHKILSSLQNKKGNIFKQYSLPTNSYQLNSILHSLQKRDKETNSLKDNINNFTSLAKVSPLKKLEISKKEIIGIFENKNNSALNQKAKRYFKNADFTQKDNEVIIKVNR